MDLFLPNIKYTFIFNELKNGIFTKKNVEFTFSDDNIIYSYEIYNNYDNYECYDNDECRYVLYIDKIHKKYCCIKTDKDPNNGKEYWFHNITDIYIKDDLIFTNSPEYCINFKK